MKQYQNEIILLFAFLLMLGGFLFKSSQIKSASIDVVKVEKELMELKELIGVMNIWKNKKVVQKLLKTKSVISPSKVIWKKRGNKVTSLFKNLSSIEVNRVMNKILNLPVEITQLKMQKKSELYEVEFKCKW